ncbi:O-antigen ligase family protein [Patescibacteria group bacterium]|nr:O-antigen ligase family protein [Patescibacteria group bacterium]
MIGFLISLVMIVSIKKIKTKKSLYLLGYAYITSLAIVISQSRSYWVGLGAALIIFILFGWWKFNFRIKKTFLAIIILIIMFTSQLLVVNLLTGNFDGNIAGDRFKNLQSEPAGLSRLNQLKPLGDAILQQLIFGYGFGKTLTYQSNDPRIMAENPDGIYTTFAFEWGYLDIWLKIGLLGWLAYFGLIGTIIYTGIRNPSYTKTSTGKQESEIKNLKISLFLGLVAVLATNMFSPYLNHPLGIGYILLISAIYNVE